LYSFQGTYRQDYLTYVIPVLLSDSLELPNHPLWVQSIIKLKESNINEMDEILRSKKNEEILEMQKNCLEIYKYFRNNYINSEYDSIDFKDDT